MRQKGDVFRHEEELELENSFDFGKKIRFKSELDNFYINGHEHAKKDKEESNTRKRRVKFENGRFAKLKLLKKKRLKKCNDKQQNSSQPLNGWNMKVEQHFLSDIDDIQEQNQWQNIESRRKSRNPVNSKRKKWKRVRKTMREKKHELLREKDDKWFSKFDKIKDEKLSHSKARHYFQIKTSSDDWNIYSGLKSTD